MDLIKDKYSLRDIVIDCGAYSGRISKYFAVKGARVIVFEPCSALFANLKLKFSKFSNVELVNKAVYDSNGEIKLFYHVNQAKKVSKYLQASSIFNSKGNIGKKFELVKTVDLSEFINRRFVKNGLRVKLLKLNIEGAEYAVLTHLIDTGVINYIDAVIVAFHSKNIHELIPAHIDLEKKARSSGLFNTVIKWDWWKDNAIEFSALAKKYE